MKKLVRKVVLYARVSGEKQKREATIQTQVDAMMRYCETNSYETLEVYLDEHVNNKTPWCERRAGRRLLTEAAALGADAIVVYETGRVSRVMEVFFPTLELFDQAGLKLLSTAHTIDRETPTGRLYLKMQTIFTEFNYDDTLRKFNDGRETWSRATWQAADGNEYSYWMGGPTPYGYRVIEVHRRVSLEVDPSHFPERDYGPADVMRRLYEQTVLDGYTGPLLANLLNGKQIPTPAYLSRSGMEGRGRIVNPRGLPLWCPEIICRLLRNPIYKGAHYYGTHSRNEEREIIPRRFPAIVSEPLWDEAQRTLTGHRIYASRNTRDAAFLLRQKIVCGHCGYTYQGMSSYGSRPKHPDVWFYRCAAKNYTLYKARLAARGIERCDNDVLDNEIEQIVWQDIQEFILHPDETVTQLRLTLRQQAQATSRVGDELAALERKLSVVQRGMVSARRMLQTADPEDPDRYTEDQYQRDMIDYRDDERRLKARVETLSVKVAQVEEIETHLKNAAAFLQTLQGDLARWTWTQRRQAIEKLVEMVRVYPVLEDNTRLVEIDYWFRPGLPAGRRVVEEQTIGAFVNNTSASVVKGWNAHGRTLASISDPAALIFVLEGWNNMCPEVRWAIDENLDCSVHSKGSTYIFADGHARWMRVAQTLDPVNMWADDAFAPSARQTIYNNHWSLLLAGAKKNPRLRDCLE